MNKSTLWSLRLGYSGVQASSIASKGIANFLEKSFESTVDLKLPDFLASSPKSLKELQQIKKMFTDEGNAEAIKSLRNRELQVAVDMKAWWVDKMITRTIRNWNGLKYFCIYKVNIQNSTNEEKFYDFYVMFYLLQ